jgi:putative ABC transport system permease protein
MSDAPRRSWSERVYAALLRLHPTEFRRRFGIEMQEYFRDRLRDERRRRGRLGVARYWGCAVLDLARAAAGEHVAALARPRHANGRVTPRHAPPPTGDHMLQTLLQDLRFAVRMLAKSPVFTTVAVVITALGIGAVSTIFSAANAIVLRPVPGVARPGELVTVQRTQAGGRGSLSASHPYYTELAASTRALSGVAAWTLVPLTVSTGGEGVTSLGNLVSGNYFTVLGVRPMLGRFFSAEESSVPAAHPVVVLSYGFWQRRFVGDSGIVGRSILVNGSPFTVIGVAPKGFNSVFAVLRTDAWVPLMMQAQVRSGGRDLLSNAGSAWLEMFGRVAPGVSAKAAQAEVRQAGARAARALAGTEPQYFRQFTEAELAPLTSIPDDERGGVLTFFTVLLVAGGLVLMIAAVNVAGMLLARSVVRRREIAVRIALGAGRGRLVRQLVTESVVLFVLGGAAGTFLAVYGTRALERIDLPVDVPIALDLAPDARVLAFTLAVALATGVLFGLAPALKASRVDLVTSLRSDGAGAGRSRSRLRNALVIGQVAMSLVLLAAAGLFLRALDRGRRVDPGFDATHIATAMVDPETSGYDEARGRALYRTLAERLAAQPGVRAVAYARMLPLSMNSMGDEIAVDGYAPPGGRPGESIPMAANHVDGAYFEALRIPMVAGRPFRPADDASAPRVAVVNQTFATRFWPGRSAIGQTFRMDSTPVTVVGVVRDSRHRRLDERPAPFMYLPLAQRHFAGVSLVVRTDGDPAAFAPTIRRELQAIDRTLPAPTVTTLERVTAIMLLPQRIAAGVAGALGLVGLFLAAVGLYGVISFSTAQRTREIGVRMALGAAERDVLGLVIGEGMRLVAIGMAVGLGLAFLATRALRPFLYGVSPLDPLTFLTIAATLAATAFVAAYLPARRAAATDPALPLRQE